MDRTNVLSRIRGPYPSERKDFEWVFFYDRKLSHRMNKVTGRKFYLRYFHDDRTFLVLDAHRRVSKRDKRHRVLISKALATYLKSRLPPEDIARCIAASIRLRAAMDNLDALMKAPSLAEHLHNQLVSNVTTRAAP